jgi:lysozyme family protein
MLQEAASVPADGCIGPVTLAAVAASDPLGLVGRYAEARRGAYRRPRQFPYFGRGWLSRVDQTLKACREAAAMTFTDPTFDLTEEETNMNQAEPKWWGNSLTIWGTIITALSTVLPVVGQLMGLDVSSEIIQNFGDQVSHVLQGVGGVLGTVMAVYGRLRATAPLQQRLLTIRL